MSSPAASPLLPVFARSELAFERGEGCWLVTTDGDRYLDFAAGVAVNALGHSHPHLVAALTEQAQKLWHVSNLYRIPEGERLAQRLVDASFADVVFFCNSGAEALEASIKLARKHFHANGQPERYRLITFEGAFHGRTLATIAAGGQAKYLEGFGPKVEGFDQVPFGDLAAVEAAIGPETAGVLIEPLQGEGGVRLVPPAFMRSLRELCDRHGLLLVVDEVQSGVGRTGHLFAHEISGVTPDVMAVAKGIGGGFPLGACLATRDAADGMTAGVHGSTFGGNPLAMAVGNAVLDVVLEPGFLDHARRMGLLLKQRLAGVVDAHRSIVTEVRGEGLLTGLRCAIPNGDVAAAFRAEGLLTVGAGDNVVRLLPPLIVTEAEIGEAIAKIERALDRIKRDMGLALARGAAE
ncbi:aspartate aminotransferase family protein [Methylopila turkensis]|uniref:Acetylornithine aminotransferase n=1 Tax=Methylopila turkensis TaxID=1437816 RepID=A0A9W6JQ35_9HYPH|nr:aspartate aminotransferase family protein [Methylopila turkensis]GLK81705.1 acetylornithine aminotransferase 1 [Methylopila turkensis]